MTYSIALTVSMILGTVLALFSMSSSEIPPVTIGLKHDRPVVAQAPILVKPRRDPNDDIAKEIWMRETRKFESFKGSLYRCPGGVLTIGYGFTASDFPSGLPSSMTKEEAEKHLERAWVKYSEKVDLIVKVPLNPYQRAALTSFTYNLGEGSLRKLVGKPGRLNHGNYDSVDSNILKYTKANGRVLRGLTLRRKWEASLFSM